MSDSSSSAKKNAEASLVDLTLEESHSIENPEAGAASLLSDQLPSLAARVSVLECVLGALQKGGTYDEFIRELLLSLIRAVPSEAASVLEADHDRKIFFFRTAVGCTSDQVTRFEVPFGKGIVGHVAESHNIMAITSSEKNVIHFKEIEEKVGFKSRNLVAVPVYVRGRVFMVIELLNRLGEEQFLPSDIELLEYLAGFFAKAIEVRLILNWVNRARAGGSKKDAA